MTTDSDDFADEFDRIEDQNKELIFARSYMEDMNEQKALRIAGFKPNDRTILLRPSVKKKIQQVIKERKKNLAVTPERIIEEYARIAFSNPTDAISWSDSGVLIKNSDEIGSDVSKCIAEVIDTRDKDGAGQVRVKFHNKLDALEKLAKYMKMFSDNNVTNYNLVKMETIKVIDGNKVEELVFNVGKEIKPRQGVITMDAIDVTNFDRHDK